MNVYMIKKVQEAYLKKICISFYNFLNLVLILNSTFTPESRLFSRLTRKEGKGLKDGSSL